MCETWLKSNHCLAGSSKFRVGSKFQSQVSDWLSRLLRPLNMRSFRALRWAPAS
ncbi:MAG: hypothetical protein AB7Q16_04465 [Vicinamibacterales bacterium]